MGAVSPEGRLRVARARWEAGDGSAQPLPWLAEQGRRLLTRGGGSVAGRRVARGTSTLSTRRPDGGIITDEFAERKRERNGDGIRHGIERRRRNCRSKHSCHQQ